ncbi:MAG: UDP-N-acetylglucosamine--N-acetylmuramyl-(pentapeptide) pyrophosphoryl-undecaprenol N-acetylglucosamine transferase, partial [Clostridiales bacterium]|nr:UDP-N-acetylglucosamine--N-acetylmuramyl-(pentapeptide) pyrophosphoryl-undecaprenol N-acetylglucosamine transferase [Clostridiales bacterium]
SYIKEQYPDAEILFIGTREKMESRLVPQAGFAFEPIEISGFQRSMRPSAVQANVKTVFRLFRSSAQCRKILSGFQPDVVVGFGGYVSGPVLNTAVKLGYPTCIHEQNAFPGITNKSLAKKVDKVLLTVEDAAQHMSCKNPPAVTGLPVRGEILKADRDFARVELGLKDHIPMVLSTGGSLGAKPINDAMLDVIVRHCKERRCYHIHSTGTSGVGMKDALQEAGVLDDALVDCREYIDNMDTCLAAADLVIGRAGASSISELQALGKPSILIPSPYVSENHQYHNAMALVNRGAAKVLEEKDLTGESLGQLIDQLLESRIELDKLGCEAKKMATPDARKDIAEHILKLAGID